MTATLPPHPLKAATSWQALTRASLLSLPSADDEAGGFPPLPPRGSTASLASRPSATSLDPVDSVWSWSDDGVVLDPTLGPLPLLPARPGAPPVPYSLPTVTPPPHTLKRVRSAGLDVLAMGGVIPKAAAIAPGLAGGFGSGGFGTCLAGSASSSPLRSPTRSPSKSPSKRASKCGPPPRRAPALTVDTLGSRLASIPTSAHLPCGAVARLDAGLWRADDGTLAARVTVALTDAAPNQGAPDTPPDTPTTSARRTASILAHAIVSAFHPRTVTTGVLAEQGGRRGACGSRPSSARRRWPAAAELRPQELFFVRGDAPASIFHSPHRGAVGGGVASTPPWRDAATITVVARVPDGDGGELWLKSDGVDVPAA